VRLPWGDPRLALMHLTVITLHRAEIGRELNLVAAKAPVIAVICLPIN